MEAQLVIDHVWLTITNVWFCEHMPMTHNYIWKKVNILKPEFTVTLPDEETTLRFYLQFYLLHDYLAVMKIGPRFTHSE